MNALEQLKSLYLKQYYQDKQAIPEKWRFAPNYSDKTANGLTKCIIDWLIYNGHQAERISVTGRYIDNSRITTDCIGRVRRIGSAKWIKSSMQKGTSDISATIAGRSVKIEVKIGKDRQSEAQKRYQKQIEQAGGVYFIAKNFEDFLTFYNSLL